MNQVINAINFYREYDGYGYFSNFYDADVTIDDKIYPSTEHYFKAMKLIDTAPEYAEEIRKAKTPGIGRKRDFPLRIDWKGVKYALMKTACRKIYSI